MSGDRHLRHPALIPGLQNIIPDIGTQGGQARHVGNSLYTQVPPSLIPGLLNIPMNPMNPVNPAEQANPPFNESLSYETRPEFIGLGWASGEPSPIRQTVVLPGTSGALIGTRMGWNGSGMVVKPTSNGLVQRFDQEQMENLGSSADVAQQNCPPHISGSTFNAVRALANGLTPAEAQDMNALLGMTQVAQDNGLFNATAPGAPELPLVGNLNAPMLLSLGYPNGGDDGNTQGDQAQRQLNRAGGTEGAPMPGGQAPLTADVGLDAAQPWEHVLAVNSGAVALQDPNAGAGLLGGRLASQGFANGDVAQAGQAITNAHAAGSAHYARQIMLHDDLRVTTAEANTSQPMLTDAGGNATPADVDGSCSLPLGVGASIADPNASAAGGSSLVGAPSSAEEEGRRTASKGQPGPSTKARKACKVDGGISKAGGSGRRQEKRKPRTYSQAVPSQHCHICSRRPTTNSPHMVCGNLLQSRCRKTICTKCFERYKWDLEAARNAEAGSWTCTHCRGECPPRAQCVIYNRTSDRRRMKLINHRKKKGGLNEGSDEGKTPAVAGACQTEAGGAVVGNAVPVGLVSAPPILCVGSTAIEAAGSTHVGEGIGKKAGHSKGKSEEEIGRWRGGVGTSVASGRNEGRICKAGRKSSTGNKVVLARTKKEFISQMKEHRGDLQEMVRRGGAVPERSDEERASLPGGEVGVDGGGQMDGEVEAEEVRPVSGDEVKDAHEAGEVGGDGKCAGGYVEEKADVEVGRNGSVVGGKTVASEEGGCDAVLEALERIMREAECGEMGNGGEMGDSLKLLSGYGEGDNEMSAMVAGLSGEGGDAGEEEWNVGDWLINADAAGGVAEGTPASGGVEHVGGRGGDAEEWFGVGDVPELRDWDGSEAAREHADDVATVVGSASLV